MSLMVGLKETTSRRPPNAGVIEWFVVGAELIRVHNAQRDP